MLTQTGEYALRALVHLAREAGNDFRGVKEIARATGVPSNYLAKILQQLARTHVLDSQKGFGGGFRIARPLNEICLFDIVEPLERMDKFQQCVLGQRACNAEVACPLHDTWKGICDQYLGSLKRVTLQDVADFRVKVEKIEGLPKIPIA